MAEQQRLVQLVDARAENEMESLGEFAVDAACPDPFQIQKLQHPMKQCALQLFIQEGVRGRAVALK